MSRRCRCAGGGARRAGPERVREGAGARQGLCHQLRDPRSAFQAADARHPRAEHQGGRRAVAWAGGGTPIVLAPRGFACSALVGADGGVHVLLTPPGDPAAAKTGPAVDVEIEGACVGCITAVACGVFPRAAKDNGFPCKTPHPARERVATLLPTVRAFIDPPASRAAARPRAGAWPRSERSSTSPIDRPSPPA